MHSKETKHKDVLVDFSDVWFIQELYVRGDDPSNLFLYPKINILLE